MRANPVIAGVSRRGHGCDGAHPRQRRQPGPSVSNDPAGRDSTIADKYTDARSDSHTNATEVFADAYRKYDTDSHPTEATVTHLQLDGFPQSHSSSLAHTKSQPQCNRHKHPFQYVHTEPSSFIYFHTAITDANGNQHGYPTPDAAEPERDSHGNSFSHSHANPATGKP